MENNNVTNNGEQPAVVVQKTVDDILREGINHVRVPDVFRDLPCFDGNPNKLHGFINRVDTLVLLMRENTDIP